MGLIGAIIIGGVVGYIACKLMDINPPLWVKIVLGIAGGFVGGIIGRILFGGTRLLGSLILGVVGSYIVVWAYRKIKK